MAGTFEASTINVISPNGLVTKAITASDSGYAKLDGSTIAKQDDVGVANSSLVKTALNASGSAPIYACRAWVNFNGTGTVAIRGSGNVSSITDNNTGDYTVNFTTAMPDANYSAIGTAIYGSLTIVDMRVVTIQTISTTAVRLNTMYANGNSNYDVNGVAISIFR